MTHSLPAPVADMVERASLHAGSDVIPFWLSDSEGVPEEGMYQLANELDQPNTGELLTGLPSGYRLVYSIFTWEQSRAGEGFATGIGNSGVDLVNTASQSYQELGMTEEARALQRVLASYSVSPDDYTALEKAYEAETNPYRDDWVRIPFAVHTLCAQAARRFHAATEA